MKNKLKTLQTLAKLGKIFSKIIMTFCIIGIIGSIIGMIALSISQINLAQYIEKYSVMSIVGAYAGIISALILLPGEIINCVYANKYFKYQLEVGTPFNKECAGKMKKLGIVCIVTSVVTSILCSIVYAIVSKDLFETGSLEIESTSSITLGIVFIIISIILEAATEQIEKQ